MVMCLCHNRTQRPAAWQTCPLAAFSVLLETKIVKNNQGRMTGEVSTNLPKNKADKNLDVAGFKLEKVLILVFVLRRKLGNLSFVSEVKAEKDDRSRSEQQAVKVEVKPDQISQTAARPRQVFRIQGN